MRMTRQQGVLLFFLLLAMIGYAYNQLLWQPLGNNLRMLTSSNQEIQQNIAKAKAERNALGRAKSEAEVLQQEFNKTINLVPSRPGLPEIISLLEMTADKTDCLLVMVNYGENSNQVNPELELLVPTSGKQLTRQPNAKKGITATPLQEITLGVKVRGDYYQIRSFILDLESNPRLLSFSNINLANETETGIEPEINKITLTMQISAYFDQTEVNQQSGLLREVPPPTNFADNPFQP
ncbi:MAG: hypothetical protein ACM3PA_01000 [Methanomassiliicoccales archaeon]